MLINPYLVGIPAPSATWNPADKNAGITLNSGNLVAINTAGALGYCGVRATKGIPATSKGYFEILILTMDLGGFTVVGIGNLSQVLNSFVGSGANGWAYYAATGEKVTGGATSAYGAPFATGDRIGIAFDNGKVWFAKNGTWQNSGDPAAGTGEAFSGITGDVYPMASIQDGFTNESVQAAFAYSNLVFTPPSGFPSWDVA